MNGSPPLVYIHKALNHSAHSIYIEDPSEDFVKALNNSSLLDAPRGVLLAKVELVLQIIFL